MWNECIFQNFSDNFILQYRIGCITAISLILMEKIIDCVLWMWKITIQFLDINNILLTIEIEIVIKISGIFSHF